MAPPEAAAVPAGALAVRLPSSDSESVRHLGVLATVPSRFRPILGDEQPSIVLVSTATAHWVDECERAIRGRSIRGVMLTSAGCAEPAQVRELSGLATAAGVAVVVSSPFAVPAGAGGAGIELADSAVSVRVTSPGLGRGSGELHRALLQALDALRRLVGPVEALTACHVDDHAVVAATATATTTGGRPVVVECVRSDAAGHRMEVDVVGSRQRWRFAHEGDAIASAAELSRASRAGWSGEPRRYEGGERASWRRLYDAVTGEAGPTRELTLLADDLERLPPDLRCSRGSATR